MQIFKGNVVCPRCNGNGLVYRSYIDVLAKNLYICDECEATWMNEEIRLDNFVDFTIYLDSKGILYKDAKVDMVYDWHTK